MNTLVIKKSREAVSLLRKLELAKQVLSADMLERPIKKDSLLLRISENNYQELVRMKEHLVMKAYSPRTIKVYLEEITQLMKLLRNAEIKSLSPELVRRYIIYCREQLKLSEHSIHSRLNALKYYFEQVIGIPKFFVEIPRPKKPMLLPKVLGESELGRLFSAVDNLKHKAILFTAYSAGLRVSEVVNLKIEDIDSSRMQIIVQRAKGKKDRNVNLSPILLDILRSYISTFNPRPRVYLFEGQVAGEPYSCRSAQQIFYNARVKAGIPKQVSFHSLRHSFATHLLEKGVDIRYIKDILGHFNIKTTERYLHVKRHTLISIASPLDDLFSQQKLDWRNSEEKK